MASQAAEELTGREWEIRLLVSKSVNVFELNEAETVTFESPPSQLAVFRSAIWWDYRLLLEATEAEEWTENTPVPQEFFGPLWPEGEPAGWPDKEQPCGDAELIFEIEVPDEAINEEVLTVVKQLADEADSLGRAYGGHGLQIKGVEVHDETPVPEGGAVMRQPRKRRVTVRLSSRDKNDLQAILDAVREALRQQNIELRVQSVQDDPKDLGRRVAQEKLEAAALNFAAKHLDEKARGITQEQPEKGERRNPADPKDVVKARKKLRETRNHHWFMP